MDYQYLVPSETEENTNEERRRSYIDTLKDLSIPIMVLLTFALFCSMFPGPITFQKEQTFINKTVIPHNISTSDAFQKWLINFLAVDMPITTYNELPSKNEIDTLIFSKTYYFPKYFEYLSMNALYSGNITLGNLPRTIYKEEYGNKHPINILICDIGSMFSRSYSTEKEERYITLYITYNLEYILGKVYNGVGKDIDAAAKREHEYKQMLRKNNRNFNKVYFC